METKVTRTKTMFKGEIISGAKKAGYYQSKGGQLLVCPDCGAKQVIVFLGPKRNPEVKHDKIYACPCGWRRIFLKTQRKEPTKPTTKRICKVDGCNVVLPAERKAYCYKCRPYKPKNSENKKEAESKSKASDNVIM